MYSEINPKILKRYDEENLLKVLYVYNQLSYFGKEEYK